MTTTTESGSSIIVKTTEDVVDNDNDDHRNPKNEDNVTSTTKVEKSKNKKQVTIQVDTGNKDSNSNQSTKNNKDEEEVVKKPKQRKKSTHFGKADPVRDLCIVIVVIALLVYVTNRDHSKLQPGEMFIEEQIASKINQVAYHLANDATNLYTALVQNQHNNPLRQRYDNDPPCRTILHPTILPLRGINEYRIRLKQQQTLFAGINYTTNESILTLTVPKNQPSSSSIVSFVDPTTGIQITIPSYALLLKHHPTLHNVNGTVIHTSSIHDESTTFITFTLYAMKDIRVGEELLLPYDSHLQAILSPIQKSTMEFNYQEYLYNTLVKYPMAGIIPSPMEYTVVDTIATDIASTISAQRRNTHKSNIQKNKARTYIPTNDYIYSLMKRTVSTLYKTTAPLAAAASTLSTTTTTTTTVVNEAILQTLLPNNGLDYNKRFAIYDINNNAHIPSSCQYESLANYTTLQLLVSGTCPYDITTATHTNTNTVVDNNEVNSPPSIVLTNRNHIISNQTIIYTIPLLVVSDTNNDNNNNNDDNNFNPTTTEGSDVCSGTESTNGECVVAPTTDRIATSSVLHITNSCYYATATTAATTIKVCPLSILDNDATLWIQLPTTTTTSTTDEANEGTRNTVEYRWNKNNYYTSKITTSSVPSSSSSITTTGQDHHPLTPPPSGTILYVNVIATKDLINGDPVIANQSLEEFVTTYLKSLK